jgi:DNA-binding PadR family transcriptional regulator
MPNTTSKERIMPQISNAESALLALLAEESMYPYQIEQEVKYRDMRFWTDLSMSSIYKLLKKLEKNGMVTRTNRISPKNRLQTLYALSEKGRDALIDTIQVLLSTPEHVRWQVDIGTYNWNLVPAKKRKDALKKYRAALLENIEGYRKLLKFLQDSNCPEHRHAVAIRPVFLLEAEVKWVDSFIESLADKSSFK